ncbi:hypothetical protein CI593_15550 [Fischerella thermalis CCMEE 5194]|nr:hypothetical protein CI593_15550 [Fischerella thermalis CCMEE 5194]
MNWLPEIVFELIVYLKKLLCNIQAIFPPPKCPSKKGTFDNFFPTINFRDKINHKNAQTTHI